MIQRTINSNSNYNVKRFYTLFFTTKTLIWHYCSCRQMKTMHGIALILLVVARVAAGALCDCDSKKLSPVCSHICEQVKHKRARKKLICTLQWRNTIESLHTELSMTEAYQQCQFIQSLQNCTTIWSVYFQNKCHLFFQTLQTRRNSPQTMVAVILGTTMRWYVGRRLA